MKTLELYNGDCLEIMRNAPDNSIDAIVTDPPYGLSFMGKKWDYDVPSVEIWKECLRVLKPGGHLLAFGGTRTYHRLAVNVEDAGFEIRDQIQWLYGQGFPKSLDVSKAIDKAAGAERDIVGTKLGLPGYRDGEQVSSTSLKGGADGTLNNGAAKLVITAPATDAAKQWEGWGTALKPANEPIVLARKPLEKGLTVAQNVMKWGTGAINIDGNRIGTEALEYRTTSYSDAATGEFAGQAQTNHTTGTKAVTGRFPANVLLDEQLASILDEQVGQGVSRFFYCAKASTSERNQGLNIPAPAGTALSVAKNVHPTVKPVKLMEYLVRLITPPGGIVLDPFMGSGTTGIAAGNEGVGFIGIELSQEYFTIAENRINGATEKKPIARPVSG